MVPMLPDLHRAIHTDYKLHSRGHSREYTKHTRQKTKVQEFKCLPYRKIIFLKTFQITILKAVLKSKRYLFYR